MDREDRRCPECHSADLRFEGSRDITAPRRKGQPPAPARVLARSIQVRCGRCGNSWSILRRVKE
jgi:hypothetical protein